MHASAPSVLEPQTRLAGTIPCSGLNPKREQQKNSSCQYPDDEAGGPGLRAADQHKATELNNCCSSEDRTIHFHFPGPSLGFDAHYTADSVSRSSN